MFSLPLPLGDVGGTIHECTGILRNNSALIFRKIPVVKIPHSAFYPYPRNSPMLLFYSP